ncbi:MAG: hypothetical protein KIC80_02435 [Brachyspira sp.]|jgi:hypothetical protein|nr:hypothetical protein [Brachyspira sp.]
MSNSLIPYSFTPGTKAKAQEVNANFIALATQIEENKEYVTEKIQETIESVNSDKADKKLLNTSLITNCIVEAPNGVIEYSGNSITIKSGLKVLIPDGRNSDGSVKSKEYTVADDFSITTVKNNTVNCVYVTTGTHGTAEMYQYSVSKPTCSKGLWYNPAENKTYIYNTSSSQWIETPAVIVATYENTDETVSNVNTVNPYSLLKENDVEQICSWRNPDYANMVGKTMNIEYVATVDGYAFGYGETQQNQDQSIIVNSKKLTFGYHIKGHIGNAALMVPVAKGDVYNITGYHIYSCYFIPCKGGV